MPTALVAALSAPIREVAALVGPGGVGDPGVLAGARQALLAVGAQLGRAHQDVGWWGAGGDGAAEFAESTVGAARAIAAQVDRMGTATDAAAEAVARAKARLDRIVAAFEARAAALEPNLDSPGVAEELLAEARAALTEAMSVVDELRAELDGQATEVRSAAAPVAAPTAPGGFGGFPSLGSGGLGSMGSGSGLTGSASPLATLSGLRGLGGREADLPGAAVARADPGVFGEGVSIRLPDGSVAAAPNAVAASAVRHALTQLGVAYEWGGTTPGVGLDCSALTQWAYQEAGLNIPRLAQEQDVGAAVDAGSLRPGDLAVWDGHVAMIVGNGTMIEAGDPVQLSPIRTTNAGQGFQGFWRPTA